MATGNLSGQHEDEEGGSHVSPQESGVPFSINPVRYQKRFLGKGGNQSLGAAGRPMANLGGVQGLKVEPNHPLLSRGRRKRK